MAKKPPPPPRPSRVTVPERCHPMAKIVFGEMNRQGVTYDELEYRSGVLRSTFKAWRTHNKPGLDTIEAALGSLGWVVIPVPRIEHLPPNIQAGLEVLAAEWEGDHPLLHQLLATVCKAPILGEFARAENVVPLPLPNRKARRANRTPHPDQIALFAEGQEEQAA